MANGYRNYGAGVSESPQPVSSGGAFSGDDRSYESLVVQADAPVIDWEMNLRSQIGSDYGLRRAAQKWMTSCWLGGDFLERSDPSGSFIYPSATAGNQNKLTVLADNVLINGWNLRVEYSSVTTPGQNLVTLQSPPSSGARTDLVILEAWRALILPAPSVANKSATGLIVRNGNVKAPDAVNLSDDLIDPNYAQASNARVQIQYRLRVISNVNLASYIDGITDPSVVANSVSNFSGPGADGSPTAYNYSSSADDKGMWVAGTGDSTSASALGTADGLMYAQPLAAVFRRNSTAFNRSSNMNGAGLIGGSSGRPDGLFADQIVAADVVDLRRFCSSDYEEIMEKAFQQVLDNSMSTYGGTTGLGTVGTSALYRDDIGTSGHAGNPDGVRRYFSDRGVTDTVVALHAVGGLPETTIVFQLSALRLPWNASATNVQAQAPSGTNIAFLSALRISSGAGDYDALNSSSPHYATKVVFSSTVSGTDTVTITLNSSVSNVNMFAELAVEYPPGFGLAKNVISDVQLWAATSGVPGWMDTSGWQATSDGTRKSIPDATETSYDGSQQWVDPGHREQVIRHRTTSVSTTAFALQTPSQIVGTDTLSFADTSVNSTLRVRDNPSSGFSSFVVTSGTTTPKTTVRDNMNAHFASLSLNLTASIVGINQIQIAGNTGYVEVDSVANGSTLNTAVGFSGAGQASGASAIMIPERLTGDPVTINDGTHSPYQTTSFTFNTAYTIVQLNFPLASATSVSVTYNAYRPAPIISGGNSYNSFYVTRLVQSLLPPAGTQSLRLVPKAIGKTMSVIAVGPGSPDSSFPYSAPGDQVAIGSLPAANFPESLLDGPADVELQNFGINTGFLQLVPFVPFSPDPGQVTLYRDGADVVTDAEGRNFWPKSDVGSPPIYSPVIYSQELAYGRRHKTAYPVLMELKDDVSSIGQKGMLVLVVFSSWSNYDPDNAISLTPVSGNSAAAVYRVRGNALSPRRPTY
jgi:hypothetical protein